MASSSPGGQASAYRWRMKFRGPGREGVAPGRAPATCQRDGPQRSIGPAPLGPRRQEKIFKGSCLVCSVLLAGAVTPVIVRVAAELTLGSEHAALDFPDVFRSAETEPAIQDRRDRWRQLGARAFGDHPFGARPQIGSHHPVDCHAGYADQVGEHPHWNALRSAKFRIVPKPAQGAHDLLIAQKTRPRPNGLAPVVAATGLGSAAF